MASRSITPCLQAFRVHATAAPVREDIGSVPNATQFTNDIIADEKQCVPSTLRHSWTWTECASIELAS